MSDGQQPLLGIPTHLLLVGDDLIADLVQALD